ncbi:hypothetical protein [Protaetiibacter intestinalis]|uniref:hypothetical protein n=1 Tax=Protaetiibacter intestinalis TaxID=2419774 RepID=UPI00130021EE|nr:hypothetical protein [Protaetiibacter intestinalis]
MSTPTTNHQPSEKTNPLAFGDSLSLPPGDADRVDALARALARVKASLPEGMSSYIESWTPGSTAIAPAVAAFCRDAVCSVAPMNKHTAHQVFAAVVSLVGWAHVSKGLPLRYRLVLSGEVLRQWQAATLKSGVLGKGTARNYRGHLLRVAHAMGVEIDASLEPITRTARTRPYSAEDMRRYVLWARTLRGSSRSRALSLLSLAAGAGLTSEEVVLVRGRDVLIEGGMWVTVGGSRPRLAPAIDAWRPVIRSLTEITPPDEYLFPRVYDGQNPAPHVGDWLNRLPHRPRLAPQRLRVTWIVEQLKSNAGNDELLLAWAGIDRGETLAGYLPFLGEVDATRRAQLIRLRTSVPLDKTRRISEDRDQKNDSAAHRGLGGRA